MAGRFHEIFEVGRQAHRDGGSYSYGGGYRPGSPEEKAWCAGWEIDCADQIEEGREGEGAWPAYPQLVLRDSTS